MINIKSNMIKPKIKTFYKIIETYPFNEESKEFLKKNLKNNINPKEEFIKHQQKEFIKNQANYFNSQEYKQELANLKTYLLSLKQKQPSNSKFNKIYELIKINNQSNMQFDKCYQMKKKISTSSNLWELIAPFLVTCYNNNFIKKAYEIFLLLEKYEKGYIVPDLEDENLKKEIITIYNQPDNKTLKETFLVKYADYFKSTNFQNRLQQIDLFLNNPKALKSNVFLFKLAKIITIYKENIPDYDKVYQIDELINGKIEKIFQMIAIYLPLNLNTSLFKEAYEVYLFMKKYESQLKLIRINVKYINYFKQEQKFLEYATFVINYYLEDENSYDKLSFLFKLGIDELIFEDCLKVVAYFKKDLYKDYLNKVETNKIKKDNLTCQILDELIMAIKTGYLKDGSKLNLFAFFLKIPVQINSNKLVLADMKKNYVGLVLKKDNLRLVRSILRDFLSLDNLQIITNYMEQNNIKDSHFCQITEKDDRNVTSYVDNILITNDIKKIVLNYMIKNNYPMINGLYDLLLRKYLKNELNDLDFKNVKLKKPILIP